MSSTVFFKQIKLTTLVISVVISLSGFAQHNKIFDSYYPLQKNDTVFVFNNCALKSLPTKESKQIALLSIGEWLLVDSVYYNQANHTYPIPVYYKVKYKNKAGYISPSDLAICKLQPPQTFDYFLINQYSIVDTANVLKFVFVKNKTAMAFYYQKLLGNAYSVSISNNRGLTGISNLIQINYYAESCGAEGGATLITWDGSLLNELVSLSSVSDAGIFYSTESLVFPADSGGVDGKIIYKLEVGESIDESTNWWKVMQEEREHIWLNKAVQPPFRSKPIGE